MDEAECEQRDGEQRGPDDRVAAVVPRPRDHLPREDRPDHDAECEWEQLEAGLGRGGALDDLEIERQTGESAEHAHTDDDPGG